MNHFVSVIVFVFILVNAIGQEIASPEFTRFDSRKELPSDEFKMIYQDKNDMMWFGNDVGLLQFDGYDFTSPSWLSETPYSNVEFNSMISDSNRNLIMATSTGLLIYSPKSGLLKNIQPSERFKNKSLSNYCNTLMCDKNGNIWFGTNSGIFCYHPLQDSLFTYPLTDKNRKINANVLSVMEDSKGNIWIGTWFRGLAGFNKKNQQFECAYYKQKQIAENIKVIKEDKIGRLWIGCWKNGLYVVNISSPENPNVLGHFIHNPENPNSIAGDIIFDLGFDEQNQVWIGTPYGLSILTDCHGLKPHFINYQQNSEKTTIANNEIRAIYRDRSGLMWLATWGGGINKVALNCRKFDYFSIPNVDPLIKSQSVNSFIIDHKSRFLIGVQGLGFGVFDLKTRKFSSYKSIPEYKNLEKLLLNTVRCFAWDNDSNLWIGDRYKGIVKLNPKTGEFVNLNNDTPGTKFPVREVLAIKTDKKGNIWAATNNGLYCFKKGKSEKLNDFRILGYVYSRENINSLSDNSLSDIEIDNEGCIWVSTFSSGVNQSCQNIYTSETLTFKRYNAFDQQNNGLETNKVLCLFKSNPGKIWIGTAGKGMQFWDNQLQKFVAPVFFDRMDGLIVYSGKTDSCNSLWITTNKGLMCIRNSKVDFEIEKFSVDDGLQGNVFIKGASYIDSKSNLYVGGHNGFNRINPLQITKNDYLPKVHITSVKIDDRVMNPSQNSRENPLVMNHKNKYFTITFSSLDFFNPLQNQYSYMLESFNNKWQFTNSNSRSASFGNLRPGNYRFLIRATNSHRKWVSDPTVFYITIKTAPYKTWWAYLLYLLTIGSLIYLFLSLRIKNIQIQKSLELENIKRTKLENLTRFKLQFFTNISHELLTPLSILKILAEKWDQHSPNKTKDYTAILGRSVTRLHALINQLLQFRKVETGNMILKPQHIEIVSVIRDICSNYELLAEKKQITLNLALPSECECYADVEKIDFMLNNLLSNAFKYTSDGGFVSVSLINLTKNKFNWIRFEVSDNGIGISGEDQQSIFDRFYRIGQFNVNQTGIGIGLALTKNLVHLHGGEITVESEPGKGAKFCIELPVSKEFFLETKHALMDPLIDPEKILPVEDETLPKPDEFEKSEIVVLLVENEDDYRTILIDQLTKSVNVISCNNANEALNIAQNRHVDIIISDLNMPGMNGNELCQAIKDDINTSHIPFILITAMPDEKERLHSYESGADSFLAKPVSTSILLSRIKSLLKKRAEIQKKFTNGAYLEPEKIATTSLDEKIIIKAKNLIEANIADPNFSVKMMCDELGLANSTLYRKMKGILNMMPNEFIRNIRLRRAAQLLSDPAFDISEAAYSTGFNDPSYFSACFKKQYGVTPSAYQKGERNPDILN